MSVRQRLASACGALLLLAGCASSGPYWSPEDQSAAEATELAERVVRLKAQLAAAEARNAALEGELAALRARVPAPTPPSWSAAAPPVEAAPPEGIDDGASVSPRPMPPAIEQSDLDFEDGRLPETPAETPAGAANPLAPQALYDDSLALFEQHRLAEAEDGFRRFLAENPSSDLADNAQFWLAEAALRRGDTAAALAGFRAVVENYPEANKVPDALLKVGFCLAGLGEPESAATVYRELVERFPSTAAAETARLRLQTP